jgi:hypothetical protein
MTFHWLFWCKDINVFIFVIGPYALNLLSEKISVKTLRSLQTYRSKYMLIYIVVIVLYFSYISTEQGFFKYNPTQKKWKNVFCCLLVYWYEGLDNSHNLNAMTDNVCLCF